jgi:hypothetical protein
MTKYFDSSAVNLKKEPPIIFEKKRLAGALRWLGLSQKEEIQPRVFIR